MRPGTETIVLAAAVAFVTACSSGAETNVEEDAATDELAVCTAKVVGHDFERNGGAWDSVMMFMNGDVPHVNNLVELEFGTGHELPKASVITSNSYYLNEDYNQSPPMIEYPTKRYDQATYRFWPSACNRRRVAIDLEPGPYGERLVFRHSVAQYGDTTELKLETCTPDPAYPRSIARANCTDGYAQYLVDE